MQVELGSYLSVALTKLEEACQQILKTQGQSQETEKLQLLKELVKEQVKNENTSHSAR